MISRLLIFNLMTDADDPILGFTTAWINALASKVGHIDVITMQMGRLAVASNVAVYSVGKEKGFSEPRRALEFYRILSNLLRRHRYDACFAHMMPLFAAMGGPLLKVFRIPTTLWYTHESVALHLRIAEWFADHIVTASSESFRLSTPKLRIIGHGIDTSVFRPGDLVDDQNERPLKVYTIGRLSPIKHPELLIEAVRILSHKRGISNLNVAIVGNIFPHDEAYGRELKSKVVEYAIDHLVNFEGSVPFTHIAQEHQKADIEVNLRNKGGMDKAVLEAMACGKPVLFANETFLPLAGMYKDVLYIPNGNPELLADRLADFATMPRAAIRSMGLDLRQHVIESHSLERLIDILIQLWNHDKATG